MLLPRLWVCACTCLCCISSDLVHPANFLMWKVWPSVLLRCMWKWPWPEFINVIALLSSSWIWSAPAYYYLIRDWLWALVWVHNIQPSCELWLLSPHVLMALNCGIQLINRENRFAMPTNMHPVSTCHTCHSLPLAWLAVLTPVQREGSCAASPTSAIGLSSGPSKRYVGCQFSSDINIVRYWLNWIRIVWLPRRSKP